ncbi:MAG: hypothetical protein U0871_23435 [Gemmataceae bacterium]
MERVELRDLDLARRYVVQGLWLQRVVKPAGPLVGPVLQWALAVAGEGHPLPPIGFVADLGHLAFGRDRGRAAGEQVEVPGWPHTLARSYEDHLLGKVYADWTFERAGDALRRYAGKDRVRGLAFVVERVRERAGLGGVELSPAVLRGLAQSRGEDVLAEGFESLARDGPLPLLVRQYEELVSAARRVAELLGPEDVIALEQRTALAELGQYVAHRQTLQLTALFESRLPARPVRPAAGRKEVPTRVLDEDQYPVGGYSSISPKGSVESLLHSQLAYMEPEGSPDLFDVKFVRDELFYYSRDENQFLRRRRAFAFVLYPDLAAARVKDPDLPAQRIVLVLAAVLATVRRLTDWLSADALRFDVLVVQSGAEPPLAHEVELLQLLLREPIERGAATVRTVSGPAAAHAALAEHARHSQLHALTVSAAPVQLAVDGAVVCGLTVDGPRPALADGNGRPVPVGEEDGADHWAEVVRQVLRLWV